MRYNVVHEDRGIQLACLHGTEDRPGERSAAPQDFALQSSGFGPEEWLKKGGSDKDADHERKRLHEAASRAFGVITGGDSHRSENVRQLVRERLRRRYGR